MAADQTCSSCHVGPPIICGIEDLEALDHRAVCGRGTVTSAFAEYDRNLPQGQASLRSVYDREPTRHPRLDRTINAWMEELHRQAVLPP
jgi:hypothetical protein